MKKQKKEKHFIQKPRYEGGMESIRKLISENLIYPKEAAEQNIEGVVLVKFTINHKGKVIEAKALRKLGYGCDEEAVRLVKLLKFIIPKNKGLKVLFHKDLNIHFALNQANTNKQAPAIQYQYTKTQKSEESKKDSGSYSYIINV